MYHHKSWFLLGQDVGLEESTRITSPDFYLDKTLSSKHSTNKTYDHRKTMAQLSERKQPLSLIGQVIEHSDISVSTLIAVIIDHYRRENIIKSGQV